MSKTSFCNDESASNIVQRRSTDGGVTWSDMELIIGTDETDGKGVEQTNAERHSWSIFDANTKTIFIFTNDNVKGTDGCTCDVSYKTSTDNGITYSKLTSIDKETTGVYGMGLAHGISHSSGRMVSCIRKICRNSCPADYASKAMFSDDNGMSWGSSDFLHAGTTECQIGELTDGRLYLNSRPYTGWDGDKNVRLESYSDDVGSTWSETQPVPNLVDWGFADEGTFASDGKGGSHIVFVHPDAHDRSNMTLYKGEIDEFNNVQWPLDKVINIYEGSSVYSDATILSFEGGAEAGVLFERDFVGNTGTISFTRVKLDE